MTTKEREITRGKEFDLSGKVAIVTGSSRGIGRAIALKLGFHGADVVINSTDKSIPQAEEVKSSIEGFGRKAIIVTGNICEEETAKNIVSKTISELGFGHIDILVNNAGIRNDGLLIKMTLDQWQSVMNTNLTSAFLMTREVVIQMLKQRSGGSIINISSIVGQIGNAGQANYAASKAGLEALAKSGAVEYAKRGIRFNILALGLVETDLTKDLTDKQKEIIFQLTPIKRLITSEEVADAVLFLASDRSSGITGTTINVDGGAVRR